MRTRYLFPLFTLGLLVLIAACRPYHPTPFDALTEWPGKLEGADLTVLESVQVLKEEEVAGGLVILYSIPAKESGENILASTFVMPEGSGWQAQSSGWKDYSDADDFVTVYIAGGNITDLTAVSGISSEGEAVRVEWSDGRVDTAPIEGGSFILPRPETLTVRRVELLDGSGSVLVSNEFGPATTAPAETQGPAEAPGEIVMATPTASPTSPTRSPMNEYTSIPQIDSVIEAILSNDLAARQALVRLASVGCTTAGGLGSTPKCEDGQAEGTAVEFLPLGGPGEGSSVLPQDVAGILDFEAESLYGAFAVMDELPQEPEFPRGAYALFFTISGGTGTVILRLDKEGHIVRLDNLGGFPRDIYFQQKAANQMNTPPQDLTFSPEAAEILVVPPGMESLFAKPTAGASSPEICLEGASASEPPSLTSLPVETPTPSIKGYTMQSTCWEGEWYFTLTLGLNAVQPCVGQDAALSQDIPGYTVQGIDSLKALIDQLPPREYIDWCSSGRPGEDVVDDIVAYSGQMGINLTLMTDLETDAPSQSLEIPSTGIPQVDQAITAIMENDLKSRRNLVRYSTVRCTHELLGMGGPPVCEPDQEEGTLLEKFPIMGHEGQLIDPAAIDGVLTFRARELYGAYRHAEEEILDPSAPSDTFGLVFTTNSTFDELSHIVVHLDEAGQIVSLDFVVWPLQEYLEQIVGEWLIAPQ